MRNQKEKRHFLTCSCLLALFSQSASISGLIPCDEGSCMGGIRFSGPSVKRYWDLLVLPLVRGARLSVLKSRDFCYCEFPPQAANRCEFRCAGVCWPPPHGAPRQKLSLGTLSEPYSLRCACAVILFALSMSLPAVLCLALKKLVKCRTTFWGRRAVLV